MFIQIEDSAGAPVPPEEVRIQSVHIDPYPDGKRIRVSLELTPFQVPPDLDVIVLDQDGGESVSMSIISAATPELSFTAHLRGDSLSSSYQLSARLIYAELGEIDRKETVFSTVGKGE
ncbi:MAG: hypothetical protein MUP44_02205 [Anaerolineales bacterium]|nr:hypothetical protein [Anaerolineales bacterium]